MHATARLPQDNRWSWEGEHYPRGLLDHILISPGLVPFVDSVDLGAASEASDHRECCATWLPKFGGRSSCVKCVAVVVVRPLMGRAVGGGVAPSARQRDRGHTAAI